MIAISSISALMGGCAADALYSYKGRIIEPDAEYSVWVGEVQYPLLCPFTWNDTHAIKEGN